MLYKHKTCIIKVSWKSIKYKQVARYLKQAKHSYTSLKSRNWLLSCILDLFYSHGSKVEACQEVWQICNNSQCCWAAKYACNISFLGCFFSLFRKKTCLLTHFPCCITILLNTQWNGLWKRKVRDQKITTIPVTSEMGKLSGRFRSRSHC